MSTVRVCGSVTPLVCPTAPTISVVRSRSWQGSGLPSVSTKDQAAADELAAAWTTEYRTVAGLHSLAESPKGITYRNQWNDTTWLVFDAEPVQVTAEALRPTP